MEFLTRSEVTELSTGMTIDHILVIVDKYSKYTLCIAIAVNNTTTHIANTYYKYIYTYFVLPEDLVSDQDTIFT